MNGIIWNIRGIGNAQSISRLKLLTRKHNLQFIGVLDPKISAQWLDRFKCKLRMDHCLANDSPKGRIWVFWKSSLMMTLVSCSEQQITLLVSSQPDTTFYFTVAHANCTISERCLLWDYLMDFSTSYAKLWLVGGDFNSILHPSEKRGGRLAFSLTSSDFQACITATGLEDAGFTGKPFTWFNCQKANGIWARLD